MYNLHSFKRHRLGALLGAVSAFLALQPTYADYPSAVLSDGPKAYFRFNDDTNRLAINKNSGSLGVAANANNDLPGVHSIPGAIVGTTDRASFFDFSNRTSIPWNPAINRANNLPFTVEAWFYPASDQINGGQCPMNNRYAYSGVNRQGWVFFQRAPDASYTGKPGFEGVGWNFRMYRGDGGSSGLDVTSQVSYQIGKWTHVAVVYDPLDVTNATVTMYIDGSAASTNVWTGGATGEQPGYVANSNDHPESEAINGPAALSLGNYNNTASSLNPYIGGVDEFAFYPSKLTPTDIASHYQNGTNSARVTPYDALIQTASPVAYLRLGEVAPGPDVAVNMGDLRAGGVATHTAAVNHPVTGPLAGSTDSAAAGYHFRNGSATTTIPFIAANNPDSGVPFTFEAWIRPTSDRQNPGAAPFGNRFVRGTARTGWTVFQRAPNASYTGVSGYSGVGWNFRMYNGFNGSGQDVTTEVEYKVGEWQHFVVTWEPQTDMGTLENGNHQTEGILTAYINGIPVATNTAAQYSANIDPTEDGSPASDLAVGSYNAASGLGSNPFEGDIDEVAIYNNYVLKPEQVLNHYQAGSNPHPATNYETLVLTAASDGAGTQRLMPATYLRFNGPSPFPAENSGSLGGIADGNRILASQSTGPRSPAYPGFDASNAGLSLDGLASWVSLDNPVGLNIAGQITLEAWIKPNAIQGELARILSHGTPTLSSYLTGPPPETNGSVLNGPEVFLRIEEAGAKYVVGSSDGTNFHGTSASVPAGDLGSTSWIHLAGTYDGTHWKLFRNGIELASAADVVGALLVADGGWSIGSTGNGWENYFAGEIDEAAIYAKSLSPTQIQAHYSAAINAPGPLTVAISITAGVISVTWTAGTLQAADQVDGTYIDVTGAKSPYTPAAGKITQYYRLR